MPASPTPTRRRRRVLHALLCAAVGIAPALVVADVAAAAPPPEFTGWSTQAAGGAQVTFSADTAQKHSGSVSLRIADSSPLAGGVYGATAQGVSVTPSTTYTFSVWVRAEAAAAGSGFIVTDNAGTRQTVPAGTHGWQQMTWTTTTSATDTSIPIIIAVQDLATYWFDDFTMTAAGSSATPIVNGGFEDWRNSIGIDLADMFFDSGQAIVPIDTVVPSVTWSVSDESGGVVRSGSLNTSAGPVSLDLHDLGPGYYGLHLEGDNVVRDTSFTVVDGLATVPAISTRFGTTLHPATHQGVQQDVMSRELGIGSARVDVRWEDIEKSAGVYTWDAGTDAEISRLKAKGILPVLVLAYHGPSGNTTGYTGFVAAAALHYGSGVAYQIYNEFNVAATNKSACGTSAACYLDLLTPAAQAVRDNAPGALVVGPEVGGTTADWLTTKASFNWLASFLSLGGASKVDVISVHNYAGTSAPEGHNDKVIKAIKDLMADHGVASKPLWLDETGYYTSAGNGITEMQQASYLVRDAAQSLAQGVDRYMVYDMLDDWNDIHVSEGNYGLVRNPVAQRGLLAPKPAFTAMAVLLRQIGERTTAAIEDIGAGNHSVLFTGGTAAPVHVLWAETPSVVGLSASGPITVTDRFGRAQQLVPTNGRLELALSGEPVYVTGPGVVLDQSGAEGWSISVPVDSVEGNPVAVPVEVDRTGQAGADQSITFREHGGTATATVVAQAGAVTSGTLTVSGATAAGPRSIVVDVIRDGAVVALRSGITTAAQNPVLSFLPVSTASGSVRGDATVHYVSPGGGPASISAASWTIGGVSGSSTPGTAFDGSGDATVPLSATGVAMWKPVDYTVELDLSTGVHRSLTGRTAFAPAGAYGTAPASYADLDASGTWVSLGGSRGGGADLSGAMWATWNQDVLSISAVVIDDIHQPATTGPDLWKGDSVQFAVSDWPATASSTRQIGAALIGGTPVVYDFTGAPALVPGATASIARNANGTTSYLVTVPWSALGRTAPSADLGYSFLVNDDDGTGRKGFLEWGGGIGLGQDVSRYLPLQLLN